MSHIDFNPAAQRPPNAIGARSNPRNEARRRIIDARSRTYIIPPAGQTTPCADINGGDVFAEILAAYELALMIESARASGAGQEEIDAVHALMVEVASQSEAIDHVPPSDTLRAGAFLESALSRQAKKMGMKLAGSLHVTGGQFIVTLQTNKPKLPDILIPNLKDLAKLYDGPQRDIIDLIEGVRSTDAPEEGVPESDSTQVWEEVYLSDAEVEGVENIILDAIAENPVIPGEIEINLSSISENNELHMGESGVMGFEAAAGLIEDLSLYAQALPVNEGYEQVIDVHVEVGDGGFFSISIVSHQRPLPEE